MYALWTPSGCMRIGLTPGTGNFLVDRARLPSFFSNFDTRSCDCITAEIAGIRRPRCPTYWSQQYISTKNVSSDRKRREVWLIFGVESREDWDVDESRRRVSHEEYSHWDRRQIVSISAHIPDSAFHKNTGPGLRQRNTGRERACGTLELWNSRTLDIAPRHCFSADTKDVPVTY